MWYDFDKDDISWDSIMWERKHNSKYNFSRERQCFILTYNISKNAQTQIIVYHVEDSETKVISR